MVRGSCQGLHAVFYSVDSKIMSCTPRIEASYDWFTVHVSFRVGSRESAQQRGQAAEEHETIKREYDFSKSARGKFHKAGAQLVLSVYLDAKVRDYLADKASKKGVELTDMVNDLLSCTVSP